MFVHMGIFQLDFILHVVESPMTCSYLSLSQEVWLRFFVGTHINYYNICLYELQISTIVQNLFNKSSIKLTTPLVFSEN